MTVAEAQISDGDLTSARNTAKAMLESSTDAGNRKLRQRSSKTPGSVLEDL